MKIVEEYTGKQYKKIEIRNANYIGDYAIRLKFNDGTERLVDFKSFLRVHEIIKSGFQKEK